MSYYRVKNIIDKRKENRVIAYDDSVRHHYENDRKWQHTKIVLQKQLNKEANDIKRKALKSKREPIPVVTFLQCNEFLILM